jgi:hypothetical protein
MLGRAAAIWPDQIMTAALVNGGSSTLALGYDGVAFFSTRTPRMPRASSRARSRMTCRLALTGANFATALATGKAYVGRDNAPMGCFSGGTLPDPDGRPDPREDGARPRPANFFSPAAAYGAAAANAPSSNTFYGAARSSSTRSSPARRPGTCSMSRCRFAASCGSSASRRSSFSAPRRHDDPVFERDMYQYGVRARGVATYGLWFTCIRGNT